MKKITIITMQLKTPGGIERFFSTLATILSDNYEIEIVANYGKPSDTLAFPIPDKVKITYLSPNQPAEISMKNLLLSLSWQKIPTEIRRRIKINQTQNQAFQHFLKNLKTDYIITDRAIYNTLVQKYYHGYAKKLATDHNHHQNSPKYINSLLKSLKGFDALILPTSELMHFYQKRIQPVKCYYIPIPLSDIPTQKSSLNSKNLLSVGRLVPEKDYSTLIDIMNQIHKKDPSVHLTIIGDGQELSNIQSKIHSYHLENAVSLTGWLSPKEIKKYYYESSLFVVTSKTEAFGLVLAEAMSYGLPCIAFDRASGALTQLKDGIGFLIPQKDSQKMTDTILNLLNDPTALKKQQPLLERAVQKHDLKNVKKDWLSILKSI